MKKLSVLIGVFGILFLFQTFVSGQTGQRLKLKNGAALAIVGNFYEDVSALKIAEREFEAEFVAAGKANALSEKLLGKLKSTNRKLYDQTRKITTAAELRQNGERLYLRVLSSVNLAPFRGKNQKVRCRVFLMEIRSNGNVSYLPVITSIRKI